MEATNAKESLSGSIDLWCPLINDFQENQDFFNVRYQVKPFMLWIWISVILISFGGLISFVKKEYEKLFKN